LVALLTLASIRCGPCRAEEPARPPAAESIAPPAPEPPSCCPKEPCCAKEPSTRLWGSSEYLLWWVRKGPLPIPLVTANPDQTTIAALNEPGTTVLFGGDGLSYHRFSGVRTTLGGWLDCNERFGLEGSGFLLERRSADFQAETPGVSGPVL